MQKTTRWIVIGASGTLGLGLIAGGALTAANAFEIRDANGVTVETVPASGSDVSPTPEPATPTTTDGSDTMTPTASPVTSSPSSPMTSSPSSPMTVSPPSPVTPDTPPTPPTPGSVD